MVTKLGKDQIGQDTIRNFEENEIYTKHVWTTPDAPSGTALISVDKAGENSIVVIGGANDCLKPSEVEADDVRGTIKGARVVLCQLEVPVSVSVAALRVAHECGTLSVLNTAPMRAGLPDDLFKYADIVCANETELESITSMPVSSLSEIEAAAQSLVKTKNLKHAIITLGSKGCLYVSGSSAACKHIEIENKVKVVDTTGAGDSFIGGLAYFLASQGSDQDITDRMPEIIRKANVVAGYSVQHQGAQASLGHRKDFPKSLFE
eukprot:TRINITY_DN7921_c0_g1_i1.p1 TRINITY_DN7921_c0_g1~~TRINITY_DN7921_c0_g1_i1.p1  ORF type:complete len:263 (-),score=57.59 TRINITY_DN7921_c0_g1_i1:48-836(-)